MAKRGLQGAMMRTMKLREHTATVTGKELIAPHFLRVHLRTDTLFEDLELAPTAWIRGWFPSVPAAASDTNGVETKVTEHQRGYTLSTSNAETGEFSLDFVLHEPAGPASAWASRCEAGDTLAVNALGSSKFEVPDELAAGYLLIGDSAAIPGLSGIIRALPSHANIELYLEQHSPDDLLIPMPEHPGMRTQWVPRSGADSLSAALEARDWSNWYAWVIPESNPAEPAPIGTRYGPLFSVCRRTRQVGDNSVGFSSSQAPQTAPNRHESRIRTKSPHEPGAQPDRHTTRAGRMTQAHNPTGTPQEPGAQPDRHTTRDAHHPTSA